MGLETFKQLLHFYADNGVEKIYIKSLAANDNSKNQIYFGPGFKAVTLFPMGEIVPDEKPGNTTFKAPLDYYWIGDDLSLVHAPNAQVILYPQYPEIRFSGFLKGAKKQHLSAVRPSINSRVVGRLLFLGVNGKNGRTIGSVFEPDTPVNRDFRSLEGSLSKASEIFFELFTLTPAITVTDTRTSLLQELCRIHRLGWIDSQRLDKKGNRMPCNAPQCGGYTLEAELGITPNGRSEPDFMGWEVKQHSSSVITLMTPAPTGGMYVEKGAEAFVRSFGYTDRSGKPDRLNFGGTHYCGEKHHLTGLTLTVSGYDQKKNIITNPLGGLELCSDDGTIAASWAFSGVLNHWNRKHRSAVYVPCVHRTKPSNQYQYDQTVLLCEGTDPLLLIGAITQGKIYYDPGIKLEGAGTTAPTMKQRNQFRVKLKDLDGLYERALFEDVQKYCK